MKYQINDGDFVYCKDYDSIQEAEADAESEIRLMLYGDLEDWTIREEESGKIVRTFKPSIDWE